MAMSTTFSNLKSHKKNSLAEVQDERLTSRHITALMKLDDTLLENEKLKTRIDILEKETGSCLELHEFARNSKQRISQLEESYSNEKKQLQDHYEAKVSESKDLIEIHVTDLKRVEKENGELKSQLCRMKTEQLQKEKDHLTEMDEMRNINTQIRDKLSTLDDEMDIVLKKLDVVNNENLQLKEILKTTQIKNESLSAYNNRLEEIVEEKSRCLDNEETPFIALDHLEKETEKDEKITDLNKKLSLYELERDIMIQSKSEMEVEIKHLQKKLSTFKVSEKIIPVKSSSKPIDRLKSAQKPR